MLGFMAAGTDGEVSGFALLRVAVTSALASYLNDLHSRLGLTHQNLDALAGYFKKNLDLVLFKEDAQSANAALCVDIRNIITHNRGIVNRFFIQRNPRFADDLGKRVVLEKEFSREMLGTLGYCARQLDIRAIKKFGLATIEPEPGEPAETPSPDDPV